MIEFKWEWIEVSDSIIKEWTHTFCELQITVVDQVVTANRGIDTQVYKNSTLVPLYEITEWFLLNWWYLFYETNSQNFNYWQKHNLRAASSGFPVPDLTFNPTQTGIKVDYKQYAPVGTRIEFVQDGKQWIKKIDLKKIISKLVEAVIAKLEQTGITQTRVEWLWEHIQSLEKDEESYFISCATLGVDPESLHPDVEKSLEELVGILGFNSALDLLDVSNIDRIIHDYAIIKELIDKYNKYKEASIFGIEGNEELKSIVNGNNVPYKAGYNIARQLRSHIGLDYRNGLDDILKSLKISINTNNETLPKGVSGVSLSTASRHVNLLNPTRFFESLNFLKARTLGEIVVNGASPYHILTSSRLPRQQFNRAFAAEILIPKELLESYCSFGNSYLGEGDIEFIAIENEVSTELVRWHAKNHKLYQHMDMDM